MAVTPQGRPGYCIVILCNAGIMSIQEGMVDIDNQSSTVVQASAQSSSTSASHTSMKQLAMYHIHHVAEVKSFDILAATSGGSAYAAQAEKPIQAREQR